MMADGVYRNHLRVEKTEAVAAHGMVASKHPLASEAGLEMLRLGGNAVDAAAATAFATGVVEPWMSGLGGVGLLVYYAAKEGRVRVFDFNGRSPLAATEDMFPLGEGYEKELFTWRAVEGKRNLMGYQSIIVPGVPAGLALALKEAGSMDLRTVLQPAIRLAEEGFPLDWHTLLRVAADAPNIARFPDTAEVFFQNGFPRLVGMGPELPRLKQPDLARTLRTLADEGIDAFYRGSIARQIVAAMEEHEGLISAEDLATYEALVVDNPVQQAYGDATLVATPPPSGGPAVAATLAALDAMYMAQQGHNSLAALMAFANASRAVFEERLTRQGASGGSMVNRGPADGSTTHLCTVDGQRNMVSLTQTLLSGFGSRVTIPGTGILMNNGMYWFDPEPGKANSVRGGVRPLANMAPILLLRDGRPLATLGASGGRRIIGAMAQIAVNLVSYGMGMQDAIAAPRIDVSTPQLIADDRIPAATLDGLASLGMPVVAVEETFSPRQFASPVGILVDEDAGVLRGGADPFHAATCAGF